MDKGAGKGSTLELSPGELVGPMVGAVGQPNGGQEFLGALAGKGADAAGQKKGEEDVFLDREGGEKMEKLKHKANFKAPKGGEFGVIQRVERVPLEVGLASGGGVQSSEDMEEGAFAAAAGSGDGDNLAGKDFEADPSQGVNLGIPRGVGFMKIASFEHRKEQIL